MRSFASIPEFLGFLVEAKAKMRTHRRGALERGAEVIEAEAKASLGEYQTAAGPFPGWPELAESTQEARARAGYSADDPLLRSNTLQGAITHEVYDGFAMVGVPEWGEVEPEGTAVSEVARDMEFGSLRAPPRPFMGPAAYRKGEEAARAAGAHIVSALVGRDVDPREIQAKRKGG